MNNDSHETLKGLRVLVVEDESLVALNLESMLEDLGCEVVDLIMRLDRAKAFLATGEAVDVALLDVNIGGQPVYPLAEKLVERGIPIVLATGYDRSGIPERWRDRPMIQKPHLIEDIADALRRAV